MKHLSALAAAWRDEGERLRGRYEALGLARLCDSHAAELEEAIGRQLDEELTLAEAADESGYSKAHLRRLIRDREIPNAGRKGRPRIRRGDLPLKGHR